MVPSRERKAMRPARWSNWCEGCLHPIDAADPHVVLAVKHVPEFDHEVAFHNRCFFAGNPLYSELRSRSVSGAKSRARRPRTSRGTSRRRSPRPSVRTRELKPQNHQGDARRGPIVGKPTSTALLEITGSDGSTRRVPCRVKVGAPSVTVRLQEEVALERGVSYRMVLIEANGAPLEGFTALESDSGLLRSVSLVSLGFPLDSSQ